MSRNYSESFLIEVNQLDAERTGVKLAKACIAANIPALYVASAMGVSRMTIYSWFRGKPLRDKNMQLANKFIDLVNEDLVQGNLPTANTLIAKSYTTSIAERLRPTPNVS